MNLSKVVGHVTMMVDGSLEKLPIISPEAYVDQRESSQGIYKFVINLDPNYPAKESRQTIVWAKSPSSGVYSYKLAVRTGQPLPEAVVAVFDDHNDRWRQTFPTLEKLHMFYSERFGANV
jgi:hypothetical protein